MQREKRGGQEKHFFSIFPVLPLAPLSSVIYHRGWAAVVIRGTIDRSLPHHSDT
jgi:hypothetical protein